MALGPGGEIVVGGAFSAISPSGQSSPIAASGLAVLNQDGTLNTAFQIPTLTSPIAIQQSGAQVLAVAVQPNGDVLAGGNIACNGQAYLIRFLPTGAVDPTFAPKLTGRVDGAVTAIYVQANGQILIGGNFDTHGATQGTVARDHFARLNADGSLDTTFTASTDAQVDAITLDGSGNILIGGAFKHVGPQGATLTQRGYLARLSPSGQLDPNFDPEPNSTVDAIAVEANQQIVIGGQFTTLQNGLATNASAATVSIAYLTRLNPDGSQDANFVGTIFAPVESVLILPSGQILVGGNYGVVGGPGPQSTSSSTSTSTTAPVITSSLNAQAVLDQPFTYSIEANNSPTSYDATGLPDGLDIDTVGGSISGTPTQAGTFTVTISATNDSGTDTETLTLVVTNSTTLLTESSVERLNPDGTTDVIFEPTPNSDVNAMLLQPDGKIILGGSFTQLRGPTDPSALPRAGLARVDETGTIDANFDPNAYGGIAAIVPLPSGQILIGGSFTSVDGQTATNLARLNADGSLDTTFEDPNPDNTVLAIAVQPNGQILIGGDFQNINNTTGPNQVTTINQPYLARLNADGTVDTTYNPQPTGNIDVITMEGNQALIGGNFLTLTPNNGTTTATNGSTTTDVAYVARLNADGSVDTTFEPNPSAEVTAIVVVPNSNWVVIAGQFSSVTPTSTATTSTAYGIARLGANNGAFDPTFTPEFSSGAVLGTSTSAPSPSFINQMIYEPSDGKFIVAGPFNAYTTTTLIGASYTTTGGYVYTSVGVNGFARLNPDGSLDGNFNPSPDGDIEALAINPNNGQIFVAGRFQNIGGGNQPYLARLNTNGLLDPAFNARLDRLATALYALSNNGVLVGGAFTNVTYGGVTTSEYHVARFNGDGSLDTTFQSGKEFGANVDAFAVQPDGRVFVGGNFTNIGGTSATNIARFWDDGSPDSFAGNTDGPVYTMAVVADGSSVYVGGAFGAAGGGYQANLARLNYDGSLDTGFAPTVDGPVFASIIDQQGRLIIGGAFTHVNGVAEGHVARLNQDGSLDTSFQANAAGGAVMALALESTAVAPVGANGVQQEALLVGGAFTSVDGTARPYLAALNSDGSLYAGFNANANGAVSAIALMPSGLAAVGGSFTAIGGGSQPYFALLGLTGAVDPGVSVSVNGPVDAIVLENRSQTFSGANVPGPASWDAIDIGGTFTSVDGATRNRAARLIWTQTLLGSAPTLTLDAAYNPNADGPVSALAVAPDGKIYLGGSFDTVSGLARSGIARVAATGPMSQAITLSSDLNTLTYSLSGEAPEFSSVLFQVSPDLVNWTTIGAATQNPNLTNSWSLSGINGQLGSGYTYVRTLAAALTSGQVSSSALGMTQAIYPPPSLASAATVDAVAGGSFDYFIAATNTPTSFAASGLPAGLSLNTSTGEISGTAPAAAGTYPVTLTLTNVAGSNQVTIDIVVAPAASQPVGPAIRLLNLSARGYVDPDDPLVGGFTIGGSLPKSVLLRGDGPSLSTMGVTQPLDAPVLTLYDSSGRAIATASSWDASLSAVFTQVGAFSFTAGSNDDALLTTLNPGSYTFHITSGDGNSGTAVAEVYDADPNPFDVAPHLVNISGNATISTGNPLVGGFAISGTGTKTVLIRGIGPALSNFGVANPASNPVLTVYDVNGNMIAANTGWGGAVTTATDSFPFTARAATAQDFASVGAFALPSGSADSALVMTLPPGTYTAQVTNTASTNGTGLVEIYDLGP